MRICFINPGTGVKSNKTIQRFWYDSEMSDNTRSRDYAIGLPLLIMAALTPDDVDISLVDENMDQINFSEAYDLVALTAMTQQATRAYEISAAFRMRGVKTVIGGIHPTVLPEEACRHVDYVITGEGETVWNEFLDDFQNNRARKIYHGGILEDINMSPIPRYDLVDLSRYDSVYVQTTRGCPRDCDFCVASKIFGRKYRTKDAERVIEEINFIKQSWKKPFITFADDNMFCDKRKSRKLVEKLIDARIRYFAQTDISVGEDIELLRLLKKSGCEFLLIGFESIDPVELKKIDRTGWKYRQFLNYEEYIQKIQSIGIGVYGSFIIGLDSDTHDSISNLIDFINRNHLFAAQLTVLAPFPGSRTRERLEKEGRLFDTDWKDFTIGEITYMPKNFSPEELKSELKRLYEGVMGKEHYASNLKYFKDIQLSLRRNRYAG